jgi:hypothetical protein
VQASSDRRSLSVQLLNMLPTPVTMRLHFDGEQQYHSLVTISWLHANETTAVNTAAEPNFVSPQNTSHDISKPILVPGYSFAVFEAAAIER